MASRRVVLAQLVVGWLFLCMLVSVIFVQVFSHGSPDNLGNMAKETYVAPNATSRGQWDASRTYCYPLSVIGM